MAASDQHLLTQAVGGDHDSLAKLLERHGTAVRRAIAPKTPKHWKSVLSEDDVMQVTYFEAFLYIKRHRPESIGAFQSWLLRIAENNLRDAIRALEAEKRPHPRNRVEPRPDEDSVVALYDLLGATTTTPSQHAARKEAKTALERAVQQLPDLYRQVVVMYDLQGRSAQAVATALKCSRRAVFLRRARAHHRLRDIMGTVSNYLSGTG